MSIQLRANEEIKIQSEIHWISFLNAGAWSVFMLMMMSAQINSGGLSLMAFVVNLILTFGPILFVFLKNKNKHYIITNQRLYVEEGVLSKVKVDISFDKINDLTIKQKFIQRIFGAGDIIVMTGNDSSTNLTSVANVDRFKELLSSNWHKK